MMQRRGRPRKANGALHMTIKGVAYLGIREWGSGRPPAWGIAADFSLFEPRKAAPCKQPTAEMLRKQHQSIIDAVCRAVQGRHVGDSEPILVCVVDDDDSVRESLPDLLREFGLASEVFATPSDFLQSAFIAKATCLLLDIAMPGMSGPELRRELVRQGHDIPTIFITAHADFASQRDMHEGVIDCLLKPFNETVLLEALKRALKPNFPLLPR